jgi:putative Mn2+ efflux pump MntP
MTFVILGTVGLAKAFERLPPKYNDALVGLVVAAVGAYILLSG